MKTRWSAMVDRVTWRLWRRRRFSPHHRLFPIIESVVFLGGDMDGNRQFVSQGISAIRWPIFGPSWSTFRALTYEDTGRRRRSDGNRVFALNAESRQLLADLGSGKFAGDATWKPMIEGLAIRDDSCPQLRVVS